MSPLNNPVLYKELVMRMRLRNVQSARTGVLAVVAVGILWLYYILISGIRTDTNPAESGRTAWGFLVGAQFLLIGLIAPSITANAITQEKEQQTWEMLVFTRLLPGEIILGKLIGRLATIGLLLVIFFPMMLFAAYYADRDGPGSSQYISAGLFVGTYLVFIVTAVFFATTGLFMSWVTKRTLYALMMSYTFLVGGLLITTALVTFALSTLFTDSDFITRCPLMWLNPAMMLSDILNPNSFEGLRFLVYGLVCYVALTMLMLWRMIAGFRRFAYEG